MRLSPTTRVRACGWTHCPTAARADFCVGQRSRWLLVALPVGGLRVFEGLDQISSVHRRLVSVASGPVPVHRRFAAPTIRMVSRFRGPVPSLSGSVAEISAVEDRLDVLAASPLVASIDRRGKV